MIKVYCHCGIFRFSFSNSNEKSLLEIALNSSVTAEGLMAEAPNLSFSVEGQKIDDQTFIVNYEGTAGEMLEKNGLTHDIIDKKVKRTSSLNNGNVSVNNLVLGLLTCDKVLKKYVGIYNPKQNVTEVLDYETY
jgi:hypothetical protein